MPDSYISVSETTLYGLFAREQFNEVCKGLIPALDSAVDFAISKQSEADDAMKAVLAQQPGVASSASVPESAIEETRGAVVRFAKYLESLKGPPVQLVVFFRGDKPSVLARRRLTKFVGGLAHIVEQLELHKDKLPGSEPWVVELTSAHQRLSAQDLERRAARVERVLAPKVAEERERWLSVYNANKSLIEGLLRHAGKPELMPLIFDDLAETHRVSGVSDTEPAIPVVVPRETQ